MFFLLVPFTSCTMWVWHPFFTQIFSFLPLSVLWVGQWGETCWYWSYRENVLAPIGLLSFLWHANSWHNTFFCSPFQNRLFLPITDRELMENIYKVPLATPSQRLYEYLFPEDNPLFRGLFFFSPAHPECSIQKLQRCLYSLGMWRKNREVGGCAQGYTGGSTRRKMQSPVSTRCSGLIINLWLYHGVLLLKILNFHHFLQNSVQTNSSWSYRPP